MPGPGATFSGRGTALNQRGTRRWTEEYDRGTKFLHYQSIASLAEYVVVSHREKRVDHHRRLSSGQWLLTSYLGDGGVLELFEDQAPCPLERLYANVDFAEGARTSGPSR